MVAALDRSARDLRPLLEPGVQLVERAHVGRAFRRFGVFVTRAVVAQSLLAVRGRELLDELGRRGAYGTRTVQVPETHASVVPVLHLAGVVHRQSSAPSIAATRAASISASLMFAPATTPHAVAQKSDRRAGSSVTTRQSASAMQPRAASEATFATSVATASQSVRQPLTATAAPRSAAKNSFRVILKPVEERLAERQSTALRARV